MSFENWQIMGWTAGSCIVFTVAKDFLGWRDSCASKTEVLIRDGTGVRKRMTLYPPFRGLPSTAPLVRLTRRESRCEENGMRLGPIDHPQPLSDSEYFIWEEKGVPKICFASSKLVRFRKFSFSVEVSVLVWKYLLFFFPSPAHICTSSLTRECCPLLPVTRGITDSLSGYPQCFPPVLFLFICLYLITKRLGKSRVCTALYLRTGSDSDYFTRYLLFELYWTPGKYHQFPPSDEVVLFSQWV